MLTKILIAEDSADADAELNADADADVNADGWAKQWARWAPPLPCCYGQGSQVSTCSSGLQTGGAQFETQFAYLTASQPSLPAIAFQDIQNAEEKTTQKN